MPFRTLAFCSPEQPSSGPALARPGARAFVRSSAGGEDVTRRVCLPGALDKAIEARRDVTGESRDEAITSLLRTALRGGEEERPAEVKPDLGELSAAAVTLSEIAKQHRAWLLEHHATLDETHRAASGAVTDLQEFALETRQVREGLSVLARAVELASEQQRATIAQVLSEATAKAQEQLALSQTQVEAAQVQMREFEEAHATHLNGLKGHIARYRRRLRLTPTVAVSFVGIACVIAVVTSLFFVPTFQKFTEEQFVQTQVAPVVREEIVKSFTLLRTENEAKTKEFFELENARFEKFASHYRKQIDSLSRDKVSLLEENQKLSGAYKDAYKASIEWKNLAQDIKRENVELKKNALQKWWESFKLSGSVKLFLFIIFVPLGLIGLKNLAQRRWG